MGIYQKNKFFSHDKKWATVDHGFGLISRGNCAREYGNINWVGVWH